MIMLPLNNYTLLSSIRISKLIQSTNSVKDNSYSLVSHCLIFVIRFFKCVLVVKRLNWVHSKIISSFMRSWNCHLLWYGNFSFVKSNLLLKIFRNQRKTNRILCIYRLGYKHYFWERNKQWSTKHCTDNKRLSKT